MCGCLKGATLNFFMFFGCVDWCLGLDKIDYIYLLFVCCLWFGWFVGLRDLIVSVVDIFLCIVYTCRE